MTASLARRLAEDGYDGYTYSYPHKTAYRPFDPPVPLSQAWQDEDKSSLFLYLHLPFCEMRCGFCNLFTTIRPGQELVEGTVAALLRQSAQVAQEIAPGRVVQAAVGGGTPSYLNEAQLERLFASVGQHWPVRWGEIPLSLEVSPATVSPGKLALLRSLGVSRLSLGVQSFLSEDLAALHRPELGADLNQVCGWIREAGFPVFNIDLIYGSEGQDEERWERSLRAALAWRPEELYLYPLYVGKLTSLDRMGRRPGERRLALYQRARQVLLEAGYEQQSMRLFRLPGARLEAAEYCCQEDGMVGLGPGARSYTRDLHYSSEYAVGQTGVREIIASFARSEDFRSAMFGARLDLAEQRRRDLLKSLLRVEGLEMERYRRRFGSDPLADFPELAELFEMDLGYVRDDRLLLTEAGLGYSDTIGPWLYSEPMKALMGEYELR